MRFRNQIPDFLRENLVGEFPFLLVGSDGTDAVRHHIAAARAVTAHGAVAGSTAGSTGAAGAAGRSGGAGTASASGGIAPLGGVAPFRRSRTL